MAIDLASNLEPVLTQMCRVSYNNNNNSKLNVSFKDQTAYFTIFIKVKMLFSMKTTSKTEL